MKKNLVTIILAVVMILSLCACDMEMEMLEPTCKYEDCEETELYDEGYCKYHYYLSVGDNLLKDLINGLLRERRTYEKEIISSSNEFSFSNGLSCLWK